jgi:hypothetical protein
LNGSKEMLMKLIFMLLVSTLTANGQSSVKSSKPANTASGIPTVEFCEVIRHPELYNGKQIRIKAIWLQTFEWSWLYAFGSDSCDSYKNSIRPYLDCPNDAACKGMQGILNRNLEGDPFDGSRVGLILVGRFEDKEPLIKRNGSRFSLRVTRMEKVMRIPSDVPMPWERREQSKP